MNSISKDSSWRFVSNHAHVLAVIARSPDARMRDIALDLGITERTVAQIISDLVADGYVDRTRQGRRNRYEVHLDQPAPASAAPPPLGRRADRVPPFLVLTALEIAAGVVAALVVLAYLFAPWRD